MSKIEPTVEKEVSRVTERSTIKIANQRQDRPRNRPISLRVLALMRSAVSVLLAVLVAPAIGAERLPLPYYDWGACPFECCTYREWETSKPVVAREKPSEKAKEVFRVAARKRVIGITGVVITTKSGVTRILKPVELGYDKNGKGPLLSLRPGEAIYPLHYLGEGYDLFWYKGRTYSDQCCDPEGAFGNVPLADVIKIETRPETKWWVKFRDSKGRVGWSEVDDNFDHMDACE